VKKTQNKGY